MDWTYTTDRGIWDLTSDSLELLETGALVLLLEWEG